MKVYNRAGILPVALKRVERAYDKGHGLVANLAEIGAYGRANQNELDALIEENLLWR